MFPLFYQYSRILLLCLGIFIGLMFSSLFHGCGCHKSPAVISIQPAPRAIERQVAATDLQFQRQMDSLQKKDNTLQTSLASTEHALQKVKQENRTLQKQIFNLLDKTATIPPDPVQVEDNTDSIRIAFRQWLSSDTTKDSLYDQELCNLHEQVALKDSMVQVQQLKNETTKAALQQSLTVQQALQVENRAIKRSIKRQKFNATLKTVGIAIVTGLSIHLLTRP